MDHKKIAYYLIDGTKVDERIIYTAYGMGMAVLVHSHGLQDSVITRLALDGIHKDTRSKCKRRWEERWTSAPPYLKTALIAATFDNER